MPTERDYLIGPGLYHAHAGPTLIVAKAGDTTLASQGTPQNDPELAFPLGANERWWFKLMLFINAANATMDFLCGWSVPASATMAWGPLSGPAGAGFSPNTTASAITALLDQTGTYPTGTLIGRNGVVFCGRVRGGGTAGTVNFKWSQNTSDAGNLVLEADSHFRLTKLAG